MKKILYIVLDGLADLPLKELKNKTPLEAALTPNLDLLAQNGITGLVYPVAKGIAPGSDIAVINLLGYDVDEFYTGGGPLECFAEGMDFHDGDMALRVNFATVENDGCTIKDRRAGRDLNNEEAEALASEINSKVTLTSATFELKQTKGHRGVLVIRPMHNKLSGWISNTDPAYVRQGAFSGGALAEFDEKVIESAPLPGHENSLEAKEAACALNEFTRYANKVLSEAAVNKKRLSEGKLAVNMILARDAGSQLPAFIPINEVFNLRFGAFVEMPVERGIAKLCGMDIIDLPSACGHLDVDYPVWAKVAQDALSKYDAIYLHIKGPDEPAHDGDFTGKKEVIEAIDKYFFGHLLSGLPIEDTVVTVTADHSTSCALKSHTRDPVPLVISGDNIKPDGSLSFSEKAAACGSLGRINGRQVMPLIIDLAREG